MPTTASARVDVRFHPLVTTCTTAKYWTPHYDVVPLTWSSHYSQALFLETRIQAIQDEDLLTAGTASSAGLRTFAVR